MRRRKLRKLLLILIIIISIWLVFNVLSQAGVKKVDNKFIIKEGNLPMLIAHGGGNQEFPDNTLEAYYNAYSIDKNFILETDVSLTKDGVIILSHDTTLDRKTSLVNAPIIETNYQDLISEEIDFNYHNKINDEGINESGKLIKYTNYLGEEVSPLDVAYPSGIEPRHDSIFLATTLEELIKAFPDNYINVEIKQSGEIGLLALEKVIEIIDALNEEYNTYERIVLASFHKEIYKEFRKLRKQNKQLMYSPQMSGVTTFYILQLLHLDLFYNSKVTVLQVPPKFGKINLSKRQFIKAANRNNVAVHYWTINDKQEMLRLIYNGADGIMTDRPTLLKEIIDELQ